MADQQPNGEERTLASEVRDITDPRTLPINPKRIVRTYAADVAKLTGTAVPASSLPSTPKPRPVVREAPATPSTPEPISLSSAVSDINLIEQKETPHLPPLKKAVPLTPATTVWAPPKAPGEWERIVPSEKAGFLSKLLSFILGKNTAAQSSIPPSSPTWQRPSAPSVSEQGAPSFKPSSGIIEESNEREAVLARLRARVDTYKTERPTLPPVFPTPRPEPATLLRPTYMQAPAASEPTVPDRLHTYTEDFSNRIDTEGASAFSVYAAQADTRSTAPAATIEPKKQHLALAYVLGGAVLLIGGSLVLYYGYTYFSGTQPVAVINTAPPTLITGDEQETVSGTGGALMSQLVAAANTDLPVGNIRILYFAASATSTEPGGAIMRALALPAPDILLRNIGENSTVGVLHAGNETRVFFVLAATSYERTFAGMLSWESSIAQDLAPLYPAYPTASPAALATTTKNGKPAPSLVPTPEPAARFVDEVVDSHDVRAFKDAEGRTILLYGYRDQTTLLIARDETSFSVLLARLSATRTQ